MQTILPHLPVKWNGKIYSSCRALSLAWGYSPNWLWQMLERRAAGKRLRADTLELLEQVKNCSRPRKKKNKGDDGMPRKNPAADIGKVFIDMGAALAAIEDKLDAVIERLNAAPAPAAGNSAPAAAAPAPKPAPAPAPAPKPAPAVSKPPLSPAKPKWQLVAEAAIGRPLNIEEFEFLNAQLPEIQGAIDYIEREDIPFPDRADYINQSLAQMVV